MRDLTILEPFVGPLDWTADRHNDGGCITLVPGSLEGQDTVVDSNRESIQLHHEELPFTTCNGPCHCLDVDLTLCTDKDVNTVVKILETLQDYAVYDDKHCTELEGQRFEKYVQDSLPWDLWLEFSADEDVSEDDCRAWIDTHELEVTECFVGSVDDQPIDTKLLAAEMRHDLGIKAD